MIQHLVSKKVGHWDSGVRELTARALHNLTKCDQEYMVDTVLPGITMIIDSVIIS